MWLVLASTKVGLVVGCGGGGIIGKNSWSCDWSWFFCWSCSLSFCHVGIFVGHRSKNDCEKASVGRVVGSEIEISEQNLIKYGA